jgi:AcrR family transcriptional regulator
MARVAAARREEHEELRRAQILEAALAVFSREGFHATRVEAIAREAGLAKGTIYLYFPTKDALLSAAVERFSLLPALTDLTDQLADEPPERAIPALCAVLWARLRDRAPILALLLREGAARPENRRLFVERVLLPGNRVVAAYLDRCIERGALRPMDTFVAGRTLIGGLVTFLLSQEVLGAAALQPIPDATIVATVSELFLRGALPRPPDAESAVLR